MKKSYLFAIIVIMLMIVLAFLLMTNIVNFLDKTCDTGSDCIIAYTGLGPCGQCDYSHPEMQCVSLKEAEELQNRRNLIVPKVMCEPCATPEILYVCTCGENGCEKTSSCFVDSDCESQTLRGHGCIDGQCRYKR